MEVVELLQLLVKDDLFHVFINRLDIMLVMSILQVIFHLSLFQFSLVVYVVGYFGFLIKWF